MIRERDAVRVARIAFPPARRIVPDIRPAPRRDVVRRIPLALALVAAAMAGLEGCRHAGSRDAAPATADPARLQRDIAWLAGDPLEGRGTGTPGNDSAA